ncbi:cytochrome P450 [Actinomadura kijaniata]|uniref:cytochrome P450 n=1 Tax=Actinomadura kijaniata TaxID=46161 RepID=UPI00082F21F0|nr:cytochrome P450 [Actinomadura kijaniata]
MRATQEDVVARLVREFDYHDPEYTPEVAEIVNSEIRERAAVTYSPAHGGFWVLSRYEHVKAALRDYETFSSGFGVHFPRAAGMPKFSPIDYDPPEHRVIRKLMAPPMEREALRRLEPAVARLVADLVDPLVRKGEADLFTRLAQPLSIGVLGLAIGLSDAAQHRIRDLTRSMWKRLSRDSDAEGFWPAFRSLLSEEIRRAREEPGDYYLSHLVNARVDGEPISEDMLYSIIVSYCVAGHDNPMNSASRLLWYLAGHPELQERLRTEPELRTAVVEESLRRWCPADRLTRVTTRDVTIDGVTIPGGSRVVLLFDAANRDPAKFPAPDEFDPGRGNSHHHLSFGFGIHHCIGAQLSRMELRATLDELARRPAYFLTEEPRRHFENGRHIVFSGIHVRFETPGTGPDGQEG